jgi:hypothetical protein
MKAKHPRNANGDEVGIAAMVILPMTSLHMGKMPMLQRKNLKLLE